MVNVVEQIPEYHDVLVIGAGVAGLAMGCQLKQQLGCTDVRIFEREGGLGGTWFSNTYPGAGCDIPIPLYSFSFAQKKDWSTFFALHDEIKTYLDEVAARFDLTHKFHFRTEVINSYWDDKLNLWHVYTRPMTGSDERGGEDKHWMCKVLVSAVGGLSQPNSCDIKGHETFEGPLFHSARWDHSVSTKDKNIVVVGNGCSATQFIPIISQEAKQVTQFVRSKHWYVKRPANPVDFKLWRWMVRSLPGFVYVQRAFIFVVLELSMLMMFKNKLGGLYREHFGRMSRNYIHKTSPQKYHNMLIPKPDELQPGCKRRVFDTGYLASLRRSNVELEPSALVEIRPKSVLTKDGRELPADVIVMANGFNLREMGFPMKIYGRGGVSIQDHWARVGGPQVYRGCMMHGFPNLFTLMGPNTGTGHFSYIFTAECVVNFAIKVMKPILESPRPTVLTTKELNISGDVPTSTRNATVEVSKDAETNENVWIQSKSQNMVYSQACGSWYVDQSSGRVTAVYPDFQWVFWLRSANPQYRHLKYDNLPGGRKTPAVPLRERISEWLRIGDTPKISPDTMRRYRDGEFVVGRMNVKKTA